MYFHNRDQAADLLSEKLIRYRSETPVVLGIPRGSVPMARRLAEKLGGDLDVVLVHKIGAPSNPEFAVGSVSEFGNIFRSPGSEYYETPTQQLEHLAQPEIDKLRQRRKTYSPIRPPVDLCDRTVIIVDDGIATGATMLAAIRAVRTQEPRRLIVAAPVASPDAVNLLESEVDELVVLDAPEFFFSISQFYEDFPQVSDEEVLRCLSEPRKPARAA